MNSSLRRRILSGVPKLEFSPESDLFTLAMTKVLGYLGDKDVTYHDLLGASGRGFMTCWNRRMFFWDRFGARPDGDPEYYLRADFASAARQLGLAVANWGKDHGSYMD